MYSMEYIMNWVGSIVILMKRTIMQPTVYAPICLAEQDKMPVTILVMFG